MRTLLGRLTCLTWEGGSRRWTRVTSAPWLVYDERGRLVIVHRARLVGRATDAEVREYARTHGGERGKERALRGDVAAPPWQVLGCGIAITYTTQKGDDGDELVDYEHEWGEGARGAWRAPTVVHHACTNSKCGAHGLIALRGGTYRVEARGIVG